VFDLRIQNTEEQITYLSDLVGKNLKQDTLA